MYYSSPDDVDNERTVRAWYAQAQELTDRFADEARRFFEHRPVSVSRSGGRPGKNLIGVLSAESTTRLQTLLFFEHALCSDSVSAVLDYGTLVAVGSQILEEHLRRILVPATERERSRVMSIMVPMSKEELALNSWFVRKDWPTLWLMGVFLGGHRRLLETSGRSGLCALFEQDYERLLLARDLEETLEVLRTRYRNPAAHAGRLFDELEYESFVGCLFGSRSVATWYDYGPNPERPMPRSALLHHHLALARTVQSDCE